MRAENSPIGLCFFIGIILLAVSCRQDPATSGLDGCQRSGNDLIIRQQVEPDQLNPMLSSTGYASQVYELIFQSLEHLDPQTLEMTPMLIEKRPEINPTDAGGLSYTFDILEDAIWENGTPVTGHDYLFTLKAALHPGLNAARFKPYLGIISAVEIDPEDPGHFSVTIRNQDLLGEEIVANVLWIMPEYHYDPEGLLRKVPLAALTDETDLTAHSETLEAFATQFTEPRFSRESSGVSGSGPYRLESWETGQGIHLVKKENWWGDRLADRYSSLQAYAGRISFQLIAEAATAVSVLQGEDIDIVPDLDANSFIRLTEDSTVLQCYNLESFPQLVRSFLSLNTRSPKLSDKRVRRALALSVDVDEVINNLYQGFGDRILGPVPPSINFTNKDLKFLDYQPEQAKQLLAQAGWEDTNGDGTVDKEINGIRTELELDFEIPAGRESTQQLGLLLQEQMKPAGISLNILPGDWNEILTRQRQGDFEIIPMARTFPSPTIWVPRQNYHSEGDNRTGFGNAETDALIDRILNTFDEQERNALYRELQAVIYDEQPEIFLFAPRARIAIHKRLETPLMPISPGFLANLVRAK